MTLEEKSRKVKAQIKANGMFAKDVAKAAGINPMTLQRYFTQATMSVQNLQKVCDVLGLEIIIREKVEL